MENLQVARSTRLAKGLSTLGGAREGGRTVSRLRCLPYRLRDCTSTSDKLRARQRTRTAASRRGTGLERVRRVRQRTRSAARRRGASRGRHNRRPRQVGGETEKGGQLYTADGRNLRGRKANDSVVVTMAARSSSVIKTAGAARSSCTQGHNRRGMRQNGGPNSIDRRSDGRFR